MARFHGRSSVLLDWEHGILLYPAYDSYHHVLRPDLDKGVEEKHTYGHQRCSNGENATEVQGESGKDAGSRCYPVRTVLAAAVRDICPN